MAGYQDLTLEQGATFTTQMTLDDETGTPYNLTGFTVKSQAKKSYYTANAAITFETNILDEANGVIQLLASAETTYNVAPGRLVYDVKIKETASNNVSRVVEGTITVTPGVTGPI